MSVTELFDRLYGAGYFVVQHIFTPFLASSIFWWIQVILYTSLVFGAIVAVMGLVGSSIKAGKRGGKD